MFERIFENSFGELWADRFTHTWAVLFLLLLSIICWLLPLSPRSHQTEKLPCNSGTVCNELKHDRLPKFSATCWGSSYPTEASKAYIHSACSQAFQNLISGTSFNNAILAGPASSPEDLMPSVVNNTHEISTDFLELVGSMNDTRESIRATKGHCVSKYFEVIDELPLLLFLFALFLKLPHIIRILLSSLVGLNTNKLLETVDQSQTFEQGRKKQIIQDVVKATIQRSRKSSLNTMNTYLFSKFLACSLLITAFGSVIFDIIPEIDDLKNSFADLRENHLGFAQRQLSQLEQEAGKYWICSTQIVAAQNVMIWASPCLFQNTDNEWIASEVFMSSDAQNKVEMYEALFKSLAAFFVILIFTNVTSFMTWILKCYHPRFHQRICPSGVYQQNVYFILFMAQENLSPLSVMELCDELQEIRLQGENTTTVAEDRL